MSEFELRPRAEQDLVDHFSYIAQDKLAPAERFLNVARQSFQFLAENPTAGRVWPTVKKRLAGIRAYPMPSPYRSYLIFYRQRGRDIVEILAILHGSRDINSLLNEIGY